jgi:hypothetical protein
MAGRGTSFLNRLKVLWCRHANRPALPVLYRFWRIGRQVVRLARRAEARKGILDKMSKLSKFFRKNPVVKDVAMQLLAGVLAKKIAANPKIVAKVAKVKAAVSSIKKDKQ